MFLDLCFFLTTTCTNLSVGSSCRSVEPGVAVLQPVSVCPDALCIFLLGVRGLCRIQKGEVSHVFLNEKEPCLKNAYVQNVFLLFYVHGANK